jgi:hypothetical protein
MTEMLQRAMRTVYWRLMRSLGRVVFRLASSSGEGSPSNGFRLGTVGEKPLTAEQVRKIEGALGLIATFDPRRLRRSQRDLEAILVVEAMDGTGLRGAHMPGGRTCCLSREHVAESEPEHVAVTIAHEAVHARIDRLRPLIHWPSYRYRAEHRALREELAFIARLPQAEFPDLHAWAQRRLASSKYRQPPRRRRAPRSAPG